MFKKRKHRYFLLKSIDIQVKSNWIRHWFLDPMKKQNNCSLHDVTEGKLEGVLGLGGRGALERFKGEKDVAYW